MSKYIPQAAVVKENYMQMVRRFRIEKQYESAIKGFQELLKTKSTVIPAMRALGLSAKHSLSLEMRLQWLNEQEEEQAARKAAHAEKLAKLQAEQAENKNPEVPPGPTKG